MRKFVLFAGYILSVILVTRVIDYSAGIVFDKYFFLKNDVKLKYLSEGGGGEEIVVLGASRAAHHYVSSVFKDELGLNCFNYGMDGRNIYNQYVVSSTLLHNTSKKPKLFILETAYIDIEDSPGWNGEKLSNLCILYKNNESVREVINRENYSKGVALRLSNLYRYNSLLLAIAKSFVSSSSVIKENAGYVPLFAKWSFDVETLENNENPDYLPLKEEFYRKLLGQAKEADIPVVVFNSPDYRLFKYPAKWEDKVAKICKDYDVPFINHEHDSLFMAHKEWFNEPFHLNDEGARAYTSLVVNEIKDYIK